MFMLIYEHFVVKCIDNSIIDKRFGASKSICSRGIRRALVMDSDASFLCIKFHNDCSISENEKISIFKQNYEYIDEKCLKMDCIFGIL